MNRSWAPKVGSVVCLDGTGYGICLVFQALATKSLAYCGNLERKARSYDVYGNLLGRTDVSRVRVVADPPGDGDHVDGRRERHLMTIMIG